MTIVFAPLFLAATSAIAFPTPTTSRCAETSPWGAAEEPFSPLPIDDARAAAKAAQRLWVLYFHNPESVEARRMLSITFADAGVRAWLGGRAVASIVSAEDLDAGRRYSVFSFPTTLILDLAAEEPKLLHKVEGYRSPTEFLVAVNSALLSLGEVKRPEGDTLENPMAWLAWANWLFANDPSKATEALDSYLWCLDNGEKHLSGFRALHLEFLLERIAYLRAHTKAAAQALFDRRGAVRDSILAGTASDLELFEYQRFNHWLRDEDDALDVFDQLVGLDGERRAVLRERLMRDKLHLLTAWRRYEPILAIEAKPLEHLTGRLAAIEAAEAANESGEPDLPGRNKLVDDAACYFEALLAIGRGADAMEIYETIVAGVPNGRSYRAFIERTNRLEFFNLTDKIGAAGLEAIQDRSRRLIELELTRAEALKVKGEPLVVPPIEDLRKAPGRGSGGSDVPAPAKGGKRGGGDKKDGDGKDDGVRVDPDPDSSGNFRR